MFNIDGGESDTEPLLPKPNAENPGRKKSKRAQPSTVHLGLTTPVPAHSAHRGRFRSVGSSELVPGGKRIRRATFTQNDNRSSRRVEGERKRERNGERPQHTWATPNDSRTAQNTDKCSSDTFRPNNFRRHSSDAVLSIETYGATACRNPVSSTSCAVSVSQNDDSETEALPNRETDEDSSADSESDSDGTFSVRRLSRRQKLLLLNVALSDFLTSCCLSLLAPFFPQEAHAKNVSDSVSGWIFGVYSLTQFIFAPVCGKLMPKIGGRFMYLAGAFWSGGCTVLFGFLQYVPTDEDGSSVFVAMCFVLRIVLAVGCTALQTAGYAFAFDEFPNSIATVFGIMEVFVGLGFMAGPAVGGLLYGLGGFYLPFIVVGGLILLSVPINYFFLPVVDENAEITGEESVWKLLKMPSIMVMNVVVVVGSVIWSILDPTLEPRLTEFDVSAEIVGLIFLLMSAFYALTAPLWGRIADRMEDNKLLLIPGFVFSAVGMLLLGPTPIFGLGDDYNELWLNLVSLCLLGMSSSLAIIPSFDVFLDLAETIGFEENVSTYGVVAGLWSSMYALGDFIGPSIGGVLLTSVGFQMCMTYVAIACAAVVVLLVIMVMVERCGKKIKERKQHSPALSVEDDQRTSFIKGLECLAANPYILINSEIIS